MCELGATEREIAQAFEVSEETLRRWKHQHPEFCGAIKIGKEPADDRVEQSLFRRATGYSFESVKIFQYEGNEVVVPYTEHIPPDPASMFFWLKNRRPDQWRDKIQQEVTGKDGAALVPVINLTVGKSTDGA